MAKPATAFMAMPHQLEDDDFLFFASSLRTIAGIHLPQAKKNLAQARLQSQIEKFGFGDFHEYRRHLESLPRDHELWREFTNSLTTNKTDWFREAHHFDLMQRILGKWQKPKVSLWSAACSSGEEAYTMAMIARQFPDLQTEILATDIDSNMLAVAENGVYRKEGLHNVPVEYQSCFIQGNSRLPEWMKIRDEIKRSISFQRANLLNAPPAKAKFDIIFCRNVLIYFQKDVVKRVVDNLFEAAAPGAHLFIGQSESFHNIQSDWMYLRPSVFYKEP